MFRLEINQLAGIYCDGSSCVCRLINRIWCAYVWMKPVSNVLETWDYNLQIFVSLSSLARIFCCFGFLVFFSFLWWIQLRERSDVCFCWRALIMRSTTDGKLSLGNFLYRHSATCNAIFSRLSMLSWWASSINEGVEPKAERRHDEKEQARLVATSSWWKQEAFSIKSNSAKRTSDGCVLVRAKFRIHKIMLNCCNLMKKIIVDWCPHDYAIKTNTHRLQF